MAVLERINFKFMEDNWSKVKIRQKCNRANIAKHWCIKILFFSLCRIFNRRVWRYQRGNQNPYIKEEQTTQWPTEKAQKDKQRSTKHTHKTKDRVIRNPLKPVVNSGAPEE
jgi:hypothetical protein